MKKRITQLLATACFALAANFSFAQTTAMNFTGEDCNGNQVNLFSDLDAGKAVMLIFYMPNCGTCPPVAAAMQTMANNINATHPGLVKAYAFPYQNSTTCAYSASWTANNNLPLFIPMDSGAVQVAYYGGFGMPTVVLLGGDNQDVLFTTQDFDAQDTTTMRDLILNTFTANVDEQTAGGGLSAYPNPASDLLSISIQAQSGSEVWVEMTDLAGKQVLALEKEQLVGNVIEKQLDVSGIPAGTYIIRVHRDGATDSQKINITR
jgi:hypothetical protein